MKIVLFQTIQFSISTQFKYEKHFYFKLFSLVKQFYSQMSKQFYIKQKSLVYVQFQCQKTVPFQIIQFSISTQFKCKYGLSNTFLFQAIQFCQIIQFSISMPLVLFNP